MPVGDSKVLTAGQPKVRCRPLRPGCHRRSTPLRLPEAQGDTRVLRLASRRTYLSEGGLAFRSSSMRYWFGERTRSSKGLHTPPGPHPGAPTAIAVDSPAQKPRHSGLRTRQTNSETRFEPRHRKALSSPQKTGNAPKAVHQFPLCTRDTVPGLGCGPVVSTSAPDDHQRRPGVGVVSSLNYHLSNVGSMRSNSQVGLHGVLLH
jgi:hypothetical protein